MDRGRARYLTWLRDPARRSSQSEAATKALEAKNKLAELKYAEAARKLVPVAEMDAMIDEIVDVFRSGLAGTAARVTSDLQIRRRIDGVVREILTEVADIAGKKADEFSDESTT